MKGKLLTSLLCMLVVGVLSTTVSAVPTHDTFNGLFWEDNTMVYGGGSGWNGGQWVYYPQSEWWNQWFYDDPPDDTRWKEIDYVINVSPDVQESGTNLTIAINWSTLAYPEMGPGGPPPIPPLGPLENIFIHREIIYDGPADGPPENPWFNEPLTGHISIPDYNPEWVSIDVQAFLGVNGGVMIEGDIWHECLPEPGTLSLLALGALGLLRRKRKR